MLCGESSSLTVEAVAALGNKVVETLRTQDPSEGNRVRTLKCMVLSSTNVKGNHINLFQYLKVLSFFYRDFTITMHKLMYLLQLRYL